MSVDALSWAFRLKLTPVQKLTLLSLADRADGSGRSWASCKDTMARTGLSERGVQTAIREMAAMGYVDIQKRFAPNGRQKSNMYRIRFVEKWQDAAPPAHPLPEADDIGNDEGAPIEEGAPDAGVEVPDGGTACERVTAQPASPFLNRQERTVKESSLRSDSSAQKVSPKKDAPKAPVPATALKPQGWKADPAFAAFYAAYPRHDAPADAWKAWQRAVKEASAAEIMAGLRRYPFDDRPQFIPLPATWLNQQRWMAEPTVVPLKPRAAQRGWGNTTSGGF